MVHQILLVDRHRTAILSDQFAMQVYQYKVIFELTLQYGYVP